MKLGKIEKDYENPDSLRSVHQWTDHDVTTGATIIPSGLMKLQQPPMQLLTFVATLELQLSMWTHAAEAVHTTSEQ